MWWCFWVWRLDVLFLCLVCILLVLSLACCQLLILSGLLISALALCLLQVAMWFLTSFCSFSSLLFRKLHNQSLPPPVWYFSRCHIISNSCFTFSVVKSTSALSSSATIKSYPADLPSLSPLIALLISAMVGGSTDISAISCMTTSSSVTGFSGASWFTISLKCSFHLRFLSSDSINRFPSLSFIAAFC